MLIIFRDQAEKAIKMMLQILPDDHLLLSSSKRVKALILEEMAIDNPNKDVGMFILMFFLLLFNLFLLNS